MFSPPVIPPPIITRKAYACKPEASTRSENLCCRAHEALKRHRWEDVAPCDAMKLCGTSRYQLLRAGAHTRSESRDGTDGLESRKLSCMEARPLQRDADGGDLAKPRWNQSQLASRGSSGRRSCHDTQANKAPTTDCGRVSPSLFLRPIKGFSQRGRNTRMRSPSCGVAIPVRARGGPKAPLS